MKFGHRLLELAEPRFRQQYLQYKELKKAVNSCDVAFEPRLMAEIEKINNFVIRKFASIISDLRSVINLNDGGTHPKEIRRRLRDIGKEIEILESFRILNFKGLRKISKKQGKKKKSNLCFRVVKYSLLQPFVRIRLTCLLHLLSLAYGGLPLDESDSASVTGEELVGSSTQTFVLNPETSTSAKTRLAEFFNFNTSLAIQNDELYRWSERVLDMPPVPVVASHFVPPPDVNFWCLPTGRWPSPFPEPPPHLGILGGGPLLTATLRFKEFVLLQFDDAILMGRASCDETNDLRSCAVFSPANASAGSPKNIAASWMGISSSSSKEIRYREWPAAHLEPSLRITDRQQLEDLEHHWGEKRFGGRYQFMSEHWKIREHILKKCGLVQPLSSLSLDENIFFNIAADSMNLGDASPWSVVDVNAKAPAAALCPLTVMRVKIHKESARRPQILKQLEELCKSGGGNFRGIELFSFACEAERLLQEIPCPEPHEIFSRKLELPVDEEVFRQTDADEFEGPRQSVQRPLEPVDPHDINIDNFDDNLRESLDLPPVALAMRRSTLVHQM